MDNKEPRKALHRGLRALLSSADDTPSETQQPATASGEKNLLVNIALSDIKRNPFQPRQSIDPEELDDLKKSIDMHGVLEPVIVRQATSGGYELISGERRLTAVTALGHASIPAIIKDRVSDRQMHIIALVENLQRSDLNDLEIARGYNDLMSKFDYTHEKISSETGKSRSFVTNTLRLLKLPDHMQEALQKGVITAGHARAILSQESETGRQRIFKAIVSKGLNVRQAEEIASDNNAAPSAKKETPAKDPNISECENRLSKTLGTRVVVSGGERGGAITAKFTSIQDLNRIISIITGQ